MPRVKRGMMHLKRRKNLLRATSGYKWRRKNTIVNAKEALYHAGAFGQKHRRKKKGAFRKLWTLRINAGLRQNHNLTYSKFIPMLTKKQVQLDRKILSDLVVNNIAIFDKVVNFVK